MKATRATVALVRPMADLMANLPVESRISLLASLLAQEICTLPPGERQAELAEVISMLPDIFRWTEEGMRLALAANARDEA